MSGGRDMDLLQAGWEFNAANGKYRDPRGNGDWMELLDARALAFPDEVAPVAVESPVQVADTGIIDLLAQILIQLTEINRKLGTRSVS